MNYNSFGFGFRIFSSKRVVEIGTHRKNVESAVTALSCFDILNFQLSRPAVYSHSYFYSQNNKTPFQILQEKAIKNFKLIPRSRIDMTDGGFSCTLILDTHTGEFEISFFVL